MADPAFLIVGTPRSGTTLVQRLACELPGVGVPPETHFFRLFAGPLLRRRRFPLGRREFAAELDAFMALETSRGMELDAGAVMEEFGGRCSTAVELFAAIVRGLTRSAELRGEKTPSHLIWWHPVARALPALHLIAVVRDARAVVADYATTWGRRQPGLLAQRWKLDQREVVRARAALSPARCLVLRYEDVVDDPDAARAAMATFLGVAEPEFRAGARPAPRDLHLGWETWKRTAAEPITREHVDAWRAVLDRRESAEVAAICRREMAAFGYGPAPVRRPRPATRVQRVRYSVHRARGMAAVRGTARRAGFAAA